MHAGKKIESYTDLHGKSGLGRAGSGEMTAGSKELRAWSSGPKHGAETEKSHD